MEETILTSDETLPKFDINEGICESNIEEKQEEIMANLPEMEPKSKEEVEIIVVIRKYKKTFKLDCKDIDVKNLERMTFPELEGKLDECKLAVASSSKNQMHRVAFGAALTLGEHKIAPMFNLNLKGLSGTAMEDEAILQCLDEIALINNISTKIATPEMRLLMGLTDLAYRVNTHNKNREKQIKMPSNEEDYNDM